MEEMKAYLANGDALIRNIEGNYFIIDDGSGASRPISFEDGAFLLFETIKQLKMSLEAYIDNSNQWQSLAEKYGNALEEIAEFDHGDLEQTEIAMKALEEEDEDE